MPAEWAELTVAAERADPGSTLHLYRKALAVRRALPHAGFEWLAARKDCVAYRRGEVSVWLNAGADAVPMPAGEVLLASGPVDAQLPADTAVWVRT
jgi:alpha-glucosidase